MCPPPLTVPRSVLPELVLCQAWPVALVLPQFRNRDDYQNNAKKLDKEDNRQLYPRDDSAVLALL